jgi:ABC-type Mn2+/Zn2+ transport system ATPase subunit
VYVIGPNASGKTTLLETINGLLPIAEGRIRVFGRDVQRHGGTVRRDIGYVPQDFMVEPGEPYTALDVVMMGRYGKIGILHRPAKRDRDKAVEAMRLLAIEEIARRPMGKLSGGQQQKVMIARAVAKEPKLLFLDEPFSNLDPESRARIPAVLRQIHADKGLTTLIVTHDLQSMVDTCRRVVVMNRGRIVADEPPERAVKRLEGQL